MGIKYDGYKHSYEEPEKQETIGAADALKYGLSKTSEIRKAKVDVDLTDGL